MHVLLLSISRCRFVKLISNGYILGSLLWSFDDL